MLSLLAKILKVLFWWPKHNELDMSPTQHSIWLCSILSLYGIAIANFIIASFKYGEDDLMLKISMLSIGGIAILAFLAWKCRSNLEDSPFVPFPFNIINIYVALMSIAIWFVGIDIEALDKPCEKCGCKKHANVGLRSDICKITVGKYDKIVEENEKEGQR